MQDGWTPLHLAIQSRNRDIAKVLLVNGADKTRRTKVLFHIFADEQYTPKKYFTMIIAALHFLMFHKISNKLHGFCLLIFRITLRSSCYNLFFELFE
jgi:ankyrin repeat protein